MKFQTQTIAIAAFLLTIVQAAVAADSPAKFPVGEFSFNRPADWQWVEVNSVMRKAQLKITDNAHKDPAEVIFFFFGEGGGGLTQANIDRWLAQFSEPKEKLNSVVESKNIGGHKVTYVHAEGTYQSGMPGGPKTPMPNTMLMGGIIESDKGNVFIRLTGPVPLAKASQAKFRKMIEDAAAKK